MLSALTQTFLECPPPPTTHTPPANPPPDLLQSPDSHGLIACPDKYWPVREAREILQPPTQSTVAFINNVGGFQSSSIKIALARSRLLVKKVKGIAKP